MYVLDVRGEPFEYRAPKNSSSVYCGFMTERVGAVDSVTGESLQPPMTKTPAATRTLAQRFGVRRTPF
jgi:hypothetical protein